MKKEIGDLVAKLDEIAELLAEHLTIPQDDVEVGPDIGDLERLDREITVLHAKFESLQRLAQERIDEVRFHKTSVSTQLSKHEGKVDARLDSFFAALQSIEKRLNKFEEFMRAATAGSPISSSLPVIPSLVP